MPTDRIVQHFQDAFAERVEADAGFAFWKGRVAMFAILRAMGIGEGDEVILPGYTCVMDVNPVMYVGARPVFVDIEPETFNLDPALLREQITDRTRLIVAQHTYGYPCDMDAIARIAEERGVPLVEDCCLALGSRYRGGLCGTFGRAAYWSFQWNKPFTTGIGGMATSRDPALSDALAELCRQELEPPSRTAAAMLALQRIVYRSLIYPSTTAAATALFRWMTRKGLVVGSSSVEEFVPERPEGFFASMGRGQARVGLRQLRRLDGNIAHRKRMTAIYDELLAEAGWPPRAVPDWMDPVLVRYPIRVADKQRAIAEAPGHFAEIGTWFECPLHPIETPMHLYGYEEGMCPVAERACREVINLPTHPRTSPRTARRVVDFIRRIGPAE